MSTPSWATPTPPPSPASSSRRPDGPIPVTLVATAVVAVALAVAEAIHVVGRDDVVAALRGFLVVVVASQVALAAFALRRSPGAALGLFLFEATAFVASLAGGFGDRRALFAVGAAAVIVLLAVSLRAFPTYEGPWR